MVLPEKALESLASDLRLSPQEVHAVVDAIVAESGSPAAIRRLAHTWAWTYNEAEFNVDRARRLLVAWGYLEDPSVEQQLRRGPPDSFAHARGPVVNAEVADGGSPREQVRVRLAVAPFTFVYPIGAPNYDAVKHALLSGGVVRIWSAPGELVPGGPGARIWQLEQGAQTIVWYSDTAPYFAAGGRPGQAGAW
jgi:hypothetical protein